MIHSDWSKRNDLFLGRYNWRQLSMKSPSTRAILNRRNDVFESLHVVPVVEFMRHEARTK